MDFDLFGVRRRALHAARRIPDGAPHVEVEVRRGGDVKRFRQELLADWPEMKVTLQVLDGAFPPVRIDDSTTLRPGSLLVWYLWPDKPYEIGIFHHARGTFQGCYVNLIRPPQLESRSWVIEDLYLDVWVPAGGRGVLLDEDELGAAVARGELTADEAEEVRELGGRWLAATQGSRWLPAGPRRWPPETVPALRLRRDAPGTFHAARMSGRIIAYGLYLMGVVSATSIGFAAFTDAFLVAGAAQQAWKFVIVGEAIALAPFALAGRLPATRWPQPPLIDERSLFVATLAAGLAVLGLNSRAEWAGALLPVYGTLGLFSLIFAVSRWWFDREVPVFALAGVAMTVLALVFLL